jgi:hypothetical protein
VAAAIIGTVDQEIAKAGGAHLCEGDLFLAGEGWHAPLKPSADIGKSSLH